MADNPSRVQAKAVIVEEVERLRWRIWNGKATNAKRSIDRVRKVMHVYREERGDHTRSAPSRRLWHALLDVDDYLRGQSSWLDAAAAGALAGGGVEGRPDESPIQGPYARRGLASTHRQTVPDASNSESIARVPLRDILLTRSFIGALIGTFALYGLV